MPISPNDQLLAELLSLLNAVLRNKGQPEVSRVDPRMFLRSDLGLNSLDMAELTVRIEERFGVDVFAEGIVHRWGEIIDRLNRHHQ